ncbi:flagellar hook protein FlgE [Vibrio mediterranei]|uniref:flagellar hook protein FlgE n=1 Tax=Vibrio mediterranei TaxID=689 RepID=UPI0040690733
MSFNIALSGLNASNEEMGVISNNIANSGTTGFKGSRTEFGSVYNGDVAGGVSVVGISQNFSLNGNIQGTGRSLDMALSGDGFFVTKDSKGQSNYTRAGMFSLDRNGYLVTNTGANLQGYNVDLNNNIQLGSVGDIMVSTQPIAAKSTTGIDFTANLDARETDIDTVANPFDPSDSDSYTHTYTTTVFDSLGNEHNVQQYFVKTGPNAWDVHSVVNGVSTPAASSSLTFNPDGTIASGGNYSVPFAPPGANAMNIDVDLSAMSQYGSDFAVTKSSADGYSSGEFADVRVEQDGSIYATYSNGQSLLQGQLVLASFQAPQNLMQVSNTAWQQTFSSGSPLLGVAGQGVFGEIASGALESSNVDLTGELVGLMATQRNYAANTKTLQAVDQLTNTLMQAI